MVVQQGSGNVGIGTASPGYALDVNGDVNVASGKCFRVDGVCIGYVTKLIGFYMSTTSVNAATIKFATAASSTGMFRGNITLPATTTQMIVEIWGGGGSGGVEGAGGGAGGASSFGDGTGLGLATSTAGGAAGTGGGTATGGDINLNGQGGSMGDRNNTSGDVSMGGSGGSAPRGGGGGAGALGSNTPTAGNAPGGGGGGKGGSTYTAWAGQGGGSGAYSMKMVKAPSGTYYYDVGAGGTPNASAGGTGGIVITVYATSSPTAVGNDYAEMFPVSSPLIAAGDIVAVDAGMPISMKLATAGDFAPLAGIISTDPGQTLGDKEAVGSRPVALSGRVPAKVNFEGGPISIGDRIAPSSVPGVGKKAGPFDDSVGIALDLFSGSADASSQGSVTVFIDLQRGIDVNAIALKLLGWDNHVVSRRALHLLPLRKARGNQVLSILSAASCAR